MKRRPRELMTSDDYKEFTKRSTIKSIGSLGLAAAGAYLTSKTEGVLMDGTLLIATVSGTVAARLYYLDARRDKADAETAMQNEAEVGRELSQMLLEDNVAK